MSVSQAIIEGNVAEALRLIDAGAEVNVPARAGTSPLQLAAAHGLIDVVDRLIKRGAKVDSISGKYGWVPGGTALHYAIHFYQWTVSEGLLEAGRVHDSFVTIERLASLTRKLETRTKPPFRKETPLLMACRKGHDDVGHLLVTIGANVRIASDEDPLHTPLTYAAKWNMPRTLSALIDAGADVNAFLEWGQEQTFSPLIAAASEGSVDALKILIERGAEIDARDNTGATALFRAVGAGSPGAVRLLVEHGADPAAMLRYGSTSPRSLAWDPRAYIRGERKASTAFYHPATESLREELRRALGKKPSVPSLTEAWREVPSGKGAFEFQWNATPWGYDGVHNREGELCWFSHSHNPHGAGGATMQSYEDFLANGAPVAGVPAGVVVRIKAVMSTS